MSKKPSSPVHALPIVLLPIWIAVFISIRTPPPVEPRTPEIPAEPVLPPIASRVAVHGVVHLDSGAVFSEGLLSIYYAEGPSRPIGESPQMSLIARVRTGANGAFSIRGVVPNRELVFRGDGVEGRARWDVGAEDAKGITIRLVK